MADSASTPPNWNTKTSDRRVLLEAVSLRKEFVVRRDLLGRPTLRVTAVDDVSFKLERGKTIGIVGESGAGKSTVGRMLLRLIEPDSGKVFFDGLDVTKLSHRSLRRWRRRAQMIFQDPFTSLDPKMVVGSSVAEPLIVHKGRNSRNRDERVADLFERVGMGPEQMQRYPSQFSGGQLQRIAIARAISTEPDLIVCDEPVAALDMSIRAQVLNLLRDLQDALGVSYAFISHDLSLVRVIAHDTAVMYRGRVVEIGPTDAIFARPGHPYTQALLDSVPVPDPVIQRLRSRPTRRAVAGVVGSGCPYVLRCPHAMQVCRVIMPQLVDAGDGVRAACHLLGSAAAEPPSAPSIAIKVDR